MIGSYDLRIKGESQRSARIFSGPARTTGEMRQACKYRCDAMRNLEVGGIGYDDFLP